MDKIKNEKMVKINLNKEMIKIIQDNGYSIEELKKFYGSIINFEKDIKEGENNGKDSGI